MPDMVCYSVTNNRLDIEMRIKDHSLMVENIMGTFTLATDADVTNGTQWYGAAHNFAGQLRTVSGYRLSVTQCAAIIAALSPLTPWARNVELATRAVTKYVVGDRMIGGTLSASIRKVDRILNGDDPWAVLTSQKVRAFFEGILYNGDTDTVCVDRHAISIAYGFLVTGSETSLTPKQYSAYAAAYVDAASTIGIPAAKLQAITWVAWRNQRGITD